MLLNEQKEIQEQDATATDGGPEPSGEPPSYEASSSAPRVSLAGSSRDSTALVPPVVVPPAASPTTAPPTPSGSTLSPSMRSNFVQVVTPHKGINSKSALDLALPELSNLHPSRSVPGDFTTHDGSRPNLYLSSQGHTVQASLQITDSSISDAATSPPKRAFIVAESENGNVAVEIIARSPNTRLHICAESKNGNVIIRIPRDFHGPILCRSNRLQLSPVHVRFTPRVRENTTVLSMHETEAYAFIGDPSAMQASNSKTAVTDEKLPLEAKEQNDAGLPMPSASTSTPGGKTSTWTGDQVEVIANNGRIKICYALLEGEEKEQEGDLNTLVRYAQESGPISGFVKFAARGMAKAMSSSKKQKEKS